MLFKLITNKEVSKEVEKSLIDLLKHRQYGQKEIKKFKIQKWQKLATLTKKQGKENVKISLIVKGMLIGKYFEYLNGSKIKHTKAVVFPCLCTEDMESIFLELL